MDRGLGGSVDCQEESHNISEKGNSSLLSLPCLVQAVLMSSLNNYSSIQVGFLDLELSFRENPTHPRKQVQGCPTHCNS